MRALDWLRRLRQGRWDRESKGGFGFATRHCGGLAAALSGPPDGVIGATVPGTPLVLARTDRAVVSVTDLAAFPNGFSFSLAIITRSEDLDAHDLDPFRDEYQEIDPGGRDEAERVGELRLGVRFSDGWEVVTPHVGGVDDHGAPRGPYLNSRGSSWMGRRGETEFFVWPLPPPGPLCFFCESPAHGIPRSEVELDADLVRDAATRAITPWPEDEADQEAR